MVVSTGPYPEESNGPDNDERIWRGRRSKPKSGSAEQRRDLAYDLLLEGGTRHQITRKIKKEFTLASDEQCFEAYYQAAIFLEKEQTETREILLNVLQSQRLSAIGKALKKGQIMAAATLMRDAGAVIGEAEREQQSTNVELKLTVQQPPQLNPGTCIDVTPDQKDTKKAPKKEPTRIQTNLFE